MPTSGRHLAVLIPVSVDAISGTIVTPDVDEHGLRVNRVERLPEHERVEAVIFSINEAFNNTDGSKAGEDPEELLRAVWLQACDTPGIAIIPKRNYEGDLAWAMGIVPGLIPSSWGPVARYDHIMLRGDAIPAPAAPA